MLAQMRHGTGDQEIGRLLEEFQKDVTQLEHLRDRITEVRGRGEAAQGRVVAEASPTGALIGLTIDARAMRLGSDELAAAVLEAAAEAARNAEAGIGELVDPFIADTGLDVDR